MIYKQGEEYNDTSQPEEKSEGNKPDVKKIAICAVTVVALLVVAGIAIKLKKSPEESTPTPDMDVAFGDATYWDQFEDLDSMFSYTSEEKQALRSWGYTGDEIEEQEELETPASELIEASRKAQEEMRQTLSNPESPEYRALLDSTWLGQQALSIPDYVEDVTAGEIYYDTHTLNADYEKVPAHGHSLFLKVYLEDGSYAFMECSLLRYMQLADSGNIVVKYQTASLDDVTIVYDMQEIVLS